MTYLELLSWARKGIASEKKDLREMQEKATEGSALDIARFCQEQLDLLDAKSQTLDDLEVIHNRK